MVFNSILNDMAEIFKSAGATVEEAYDLAFSEIFSAQPPAPQVKTAQPEQYVRPEPWELSVTEENIPDVAKPWVSDVEIAELPPLKQVEAKKVKEVGFVREQLNKIPINMRAFAEDIFMNQMFGENLMGTTEEHLSPESLDFLRKVIKDKKRSKGQLSYSDWNKRGAPALNKLEGQMKTLPGIMKTFLGAARYETNSKGETIITDEYDFSTSKVQKESIKNEDFFSLISRAYAGDPKLQWGETAGLYNVLRAIGSAYGSSNKGPPVRINLGKIF